MSTKHCRKSKDWEVSEWVSDCCLTPKKQFFTISYREQINFQWDDEIRFVRSRIMCASGATCLPADCCFSELEQCKYNKVCWSRTKRRFAENQQRPISPDRSSIPWSTTLGRVRNHYTTDEVSILQNIYPNYLCVYNNIRVLNDWLWS
jgi:hypothetical protein